MMYKVIRLWLLLAIVPLVIAGCSLPNTVASQAPTSPAQITSQATPIPAPMQPNVNLPKLEGTATVVMVVKGSPITIAVDGTNAPITAGNFVDLVQQGVYDGLMFHRVVREPEPFVVQGGDPASKDPSIPTSQLGRSGFVDPETKAPRNIPLEITPQSQTTPVYSQTFQDAGIAERPKLSHTRGAVAMARSMMPDSASSQFYFALADLPFLDGSYAVFGYVTEGMDVVDGIQQGDRIDSAKVTEGAENFKK
jgi:peptidyl-prolyl cis-trans isomerase B (cyclophilin B)